LSADGSGISQAIHDSSGGQRAWVLTMDGKEAHRCPLPA
jgi:hypothetical protein